MTPLTLLAEDESLFRDTCRSFAEERIKPHVRRMDEEGKLDPGLIPELFQLGLMGIHIPEELGGGGGTFFMSVLAVEEISRVDASFGVFVDVQNTLVNNAIMRWATEEQKQQVSAAACRDLVGAYALSEAGSGSDAFALACRATETGDALRSQRPKALDYERAGGGSIHRVRHGESRGGLQGHHGISCGARISRVSASARRKTSSAFERPAPAN